ncbi:MAG: transposase [Candidatus Syntrophopropionicum ammoniitolerans]
MKYTQNKKILQVTEKTLIVGVDIASETHYARAFDYRGIEVGKLLKFSNDAEGFGQFIAWVGSIEQKQCKNKVMIGMQPTGHYWFNIAQQLKDHNLKLVLVNPFHVKRSKELDDNNPTKNDRKDPKTIAMLVKDGRYMGSRIFRKVFTAS